MTYPSAPDGTRHDRDLLYRLCIFLQCADQCMSDFMVGNDLPLFLAQDPVFLLFTHDEPPLLLRTDLPVIRHCLPFLTARMAASLIIFARSDPTAPAVASAIASKSTVSSRLTFFANVHCRISTRPFRSGLSTITRRSKRPGRRSAGVQNFRTVGCCQDQKTFGGIKTIHLCQQLVQCLFTLVVSAAITAVTALTDRIDLIDKNDTRCTLSWPLQTGHAHGMHPHRQTFLRNRNRKWRRTARVPLLRPPLPAASYRYPEGRQAVLLSAASLRSSVYFCGSIAGNPTTS